MVENQQEESTAPFEHEAIRPGRDAETPVDLSAKVRRIKEKQPSPTERYEARVDSYIEELKRDKQRLNEEVGRLRVEEIYHLREDIRFLENLASWYGRELVRVRTLYKSAIAFNLLAFGLVAIGGGAVSYAAFFHPQAQWTLATAGFVGLLLGVMIQGYNSWSGMSLSKPEADAPATDARPRPNPTIP